MKTLSTFIIAVFLLLLFPGTFSSLKAQENNFIIRTDTIYAVADAYTTCNSSDATNFGQEKYLKVAHHSSRMSGKYNSYIRFNLAPLFKAGNSEITGIEFGIYKSGDGLKTERRINLGLVDDNRWDEKEISGAFRAGNKEYSNTKPFSYFTKKEGDKAQWYKIRSTPESNPALVKSVIGMVSGGGYLITVRLSPGEKNPDSDDNAPVNFHSRENKAGQPYLLIERKIYSDK